MVNRAYAERGRGQVVVLLLFLWGLIAGPAIAGDDAPAKRRPYDDTGRFYFYFETGHRALLNDKLVGDVHFDEPNGWDLVLGGGGGYNISKHWGVELQAHGFETDVRSDSLEKLEEYSNIAIVPAVRFRWPLGDYRQVVPFLTAGIGYSMNDDNDQHNPRIKVNADDPSLVGALAAGLEYFLNPDVAVGFSLRSLIFPDQDVSITVRDAANRVVQQSDSSFNQTSVSFLVHMRVFFGEQAVRRSSAPEPSASHRFASRVRANSASSKETTGRIFEHGCSTEAGNVEWIFWPRNLSDVRKGLAPKCCCGPPQRRLLVRST